MKISNYVNRIPDFPIHKIISCIIVRTYVYHHNTGYMILLIAYLVYDDTDETLYTPDDKEQGSHNCA